MAPRTSGQWSQRRSRTRGSSGLALLAGAALCCANTVWSATASGTPFTETWEGSSSSFFNFLPNGGSTITDGAADSAAVDGKVLELTTPANPNSSPNGGPNIQSKVLYGFGTFESRFKTADCSSQPNSGMVNGFFTYYNDGSTKDVTTGLIANSEIDIEILCAEPNAMWLTAWTAFQSSPLGMSRVYREIDLATGTIRRTCFSTGYGQCNTDLTGSATEGQPSTIPAVSGFNSAAAYYTYGIMWLSNEIEWYIVVNNQKIILWDYKGPTSRITQLPAAYMTNLWYTPNWAPTTNSSATQQPNSPRTMFIDTSSYAAPGPTATPTPTPTLCSGCTPTPTPTATATPSGPACCTAWMNNVTYQGGTCVSYNSVNYIANFGTNGDNPAQHNCTQSGCGQPWEYDGACVVGGGGPTATTPPATPTTAPSATATRTNTPTATTSGPTPTHAPTATAAPTATHAPTATSTRAPTPTATTSGSGCAGVAMWQAGNSYSVGQLVTYTFQNGDNNPWPGTVGKTYEYQCQVANNNPTWTPGIAGPGVWLEQKACN